MPYFDKYIHVYGLNLSILWSPLKIWTPKNFAMANFRHPVSNSWLRHCLGLRNVAWGSKSHDFFQKEAESSRQGVGNPEPYLFSLPLSRSDRLPRRWGQQEARLGYTGYL